VSTSRLPLESQVNPTPLATSQKRAALPDLPLMAGIFIAFGAMILGIAASGMGLAYFWQPTAGAIVLGGTLGVIFVTTPGRSVANSVRRLKELLSLPAVHRESLVEEIVRIARITRQRGMLGIEPLALNISNTFLREGLLQALDVKTRDELKMTLETDLRMRERQGEMDAKTFEVAGGFAPTIGILGTVVGLIQVLRQFSNLDVVAAGIGTSFVSTIYGLGLANLVLLPLAHRIRARVAEAFETQELVIEGILSIYEQVHPTLIRNRLACFLDRPANVKTYAIESGHSQQSALQE
jgi:chemotaxis protein MotA